jgi:ATP/maltotriose-dependent transcriptional regulator MalT
MLQRLPSPAKRKGKDMQSNFDSELQSYFTDMEQLRGMFKNYVSAEKLPKRLIVFHGVGGVGKSSLLRMFRLHCKSEKVPVALASGDDAKSVLDVVTRWTEDLKEDGIKFAALSKTLESYRSIQAKVESEAKKTSGQIGNLTSKTMATVGTVLGSMIPGIGAITGPLGGMGAEALTDWLRGFLSKPDMDLLLDPAKELSADFLEDIAKVAEKKRMVLLLDTFEQMSALEDWVGEIAQKIHPNILMVIAGRKLPVWNRFWSGWMMNAQVEELKPMTEEVMRQLIHRYYATMRGGEPDPAQVDTIIKFARGLPMVVTSAVQLWVKYGVEDFQSVKAEIVANLVDRLMEGVPSNLIPALEAAAIVRWFDQPILRAVTKQEDMRDVYSELRRFPFVRSRAEGLALHDSVREMMDENLRVQDSERHAELHARAAAYFEKRLEKATSEEAERLGLERLYHHVHIDEEMGIKFFQEIAEELTRYRLVNRLRALLNDVNTYPLERENSRLWKKYYDGRLAHLNACYSDAAEIYQSIDKDKLSDSRLRAYALCDLGEIWTRRENLGKGETNKQAFDILIRSQKLVPQMDSKLIFTLFYLQRIYTAKGEIAKGLELLQQEHDYFQQQGDLFGVVYMLSSIKALYSVLGDWKKAQDATSAGLKILEVLPNNSFLEVRLTGGYNPWNLIWSGHYAEAENRLADAVALSRQEGYLVVSPNLLRNLALVLGLQKKYAEAFKCFDESVKQFGEKGSEGNLGIGIGFGFLGKILSDQGNINSAREYLTRSLIIKKQVQDNASTPEVFIWLGQSYEVRKEHLSQETNADELNEAVSCYSQCLDYRWSGRHYFECGALTGLVRVKYAQGDIAAIPSLLAEAEQLAQQYEYNDHLASLRMTQGHLAWESDNQDEALAFYQKAMTYALRYNRFLLDELVSGRPQGTPLRPIIPYCLERGEEGKKVLIELRDWWKTGVNDIGTPRPDTISPLPEGIPLLEAEKLAREREPGVGSVQKSVLEQIEAALQKSKA